MFRRPRTPPPTAPVTEARKPTPTPAGGAPDATRVLSELLARPSLEGILEGALAHASTLVGGDMRGYAILRRGQDKVAGVFGYPKALIGTALGGPWTSMKPRLLADGARELYEANPAELHSTLDTCGMKDVRLTLVVPLSDRGRSLGALVLDRTSAEGISPTAQEAANRWGAAVAPLIGVLEGREEWKAAARQITVSVVEAVESQEFDALGHGQAVADLSLKLGRAAGLVGRDLDELWFAATMHDLGKIHGETGHAQVGANFLHGVPHMNEAQKAIRHHHERWDGQGEPDRLAGEDIPLYARILAVANTYVRLGDLERVKAQAGKSLDPRLVATLEKLPQ